VDVGIYARLSRDPDGTATATARQEADCRALCEREGWTVARVYVDSDLSGFNPKTERPAFQEMVDDLTTGTIGAVVVWKLDRLSRQPGQFESVVRACELVGARIVSVNESADMTSPAGLAMMRVGMAFAAMESQNISLRVKRAKLEQARNGEPHGGGIRPFGLTLDRRAIVEDEAALIRAAAEAVLDGETMSSVARAWNDAGVTTTKGNRWSVTTVRRLLAAPHVAGCRHYHGEAIPSDVIPAILDRETWERVKAVLEDPARRQTKDRVIRPLSGLVRCSRCGQAMTVKYRKGGLQPLYRCVKRPETAACGGMVVAAESLEQLVLGSVVEAYDSGDLSAVLAGRADGSLALLHDEVAGLRSRREQLVTDYHVDGLISRGEFIQAASAIDDRITSIESDIARRGGRSALSGLDVGESITDALASRGFPWAHQLARAVIDRVLIFRAPNRGSTRLDPARVEVVWRE